MYFDQLRILSVFAHLAMRVRRVSCGRAGLRVDVDILVRFVLRALQVL